MKPSTIKRIALFVLLGLLVAALITELSYRMLKRENRAPQRIELFIPAGTAAQVAQGEAPPAIPAEMTFVLGDTLVVVNQDSTAHQLGPLWIPAGASASLNLDSEQNYVMECSFQPTRIFGLEVREPVTLATRLTGIFFAGLPLSALFALYGFLLSKDRKKAA